MPDDEVRITPVTQDVMYSTSNVCWSGSYFSIKARHVQGIDEQDGQLRVKLQLTTDTQAQLKSLLKAAEEHT